MINAVVAGAGGRMGGRIIQMIQNTKEIQLHGGFERPDHPAIGQDVGSVAHLGNLGLELKGDIAETVEGADVVIDFTEPDSTLRNIRSVAGKGLAMVIGTTGITAEAHGELYRLARGIPCVMSPNMSVGMNVLFKVIQDVSKILGNDYDMELVEAHHRLKKDAPSGTAMRLAKILADATGRNLETDAVFARKGYIGARSDKEIGIQTLRAGDIVGDHTVMFAGIGERIEITHRAHTRDNFARGAILAAMWVTKQPNGLYDMQNVLGL